MTLDEETLSQARELRTRLLDLQRDAERAQADYHHAIRTLQARGGSLREIATELGLSHQRVHQIVGADAPEERPLRRERGAQLARFTRVARAVVASAEQEAREVDHARVGTEHLLLAAAGLGAGGAASALAAVGVDPAALRPLVERSQPPTPTRRRHRPFTRAARRALEEALVEAVRLRTRRIGSEHVLLGLLAVEDGGARALLAEAGVDADALRTETLRLLDSA